MATTNRHDDNDDGEEHFNQIHDSNAHNNKNNNSNDSNSSNDNDTNCEDSTDEDSVDDDDPDHHLNQVNVRNRGEAQEKVPKERISLSDAFSVVLPYVLLVYSYFIGYTPVASAIVITHNFADMFLFAYNILSIREIRTVWSSLLQTMCMMCFVFVFFWTKVINAPKIIFSILVESPQCGAIEGWSEWLGALVLVGGTELLYLYWIFQLMKGLTALM